MESFVGELAGVVNKAPSGEWTIQVSVLPQTTSTPVGSNASRGESTNFTGVVGRDSCFVTGRVPMASWLRKTSNVPAGAPAAVLGLAHAISTRLCVGSTTI